MCPMVTVMTVIFPKAEMVLTYPELIGGMDATAHVHRGHRKRGGVADF